LKALIDLTDTDTDANKAKAKETLNKSIDKFQVICVSDVTLIATPIPIPSHSHLHLQHQLNSNPNIQLTTIHNSKKKYYRKIKRSFHSIPPRVTASSNASQP